MFNAFSITTSFFAEFVHTENGFTCQESGFNDLSTAQECSLVVSYAKSFNIEANYNGESDSAYRPKGCYIRSTGAMYFNKHSTGGGSSTTTSLCRKGNK